ncbi:DUF4432 family protein [Paenibacillus sp. Root444D2]|uniref:DUF4432 family protein n=1 Tax=Paenibacillus sp. Root444D2 TaxID=1736538 RepID=UPI00070DFC5D|nr:DUF4432 family protein [Paenibacillus sp. Root444D2]KQX48800.1 hypothetical protein ASD40_11580 [Paenibacillus sp. Root444D2]
MNPYRPQRNYGCRIRDAFTYYGMRTVVLENELVRISILVDKGTEIFEFLYKPKDMDLMWLTENGVQNPNSYLSTSDDPIAAFIDYYPGGWQEVFPNGGSSSSYKGAQFGQHGEVAHMPWHYEITQDTTERISVRFSVRTKKVPFSLTKTMSLVSGQATLYIDEEVENLSDYSQRYMWGQHIALGKPFLDESCLIHMPAGVRIRTEEANQNPSGRVKRGNEYEWPLAYNELGELVDLSQLPPKGTASEIVYLTGFGNNGWYSVVNGQKGIGMKVEWDARTLPYLWYWQEFGATTSYPWYGRHYNIGLEPFVGYPTYGIEEAISNGSAGSIEPYERKKFAMQVSVFV